MWIAGQALTEKLWAGDAVPVFLGIGIFGVWNGPLLHHERQPIFVNFWWPFLHKSSQVLCDGVNLVIKSGGGICGNLQRGRVFWMQQKLLHLHSEIPFSAGIRRQVAALGVPESSRRGAKDDRQGSSWSRLPCWLGTTTDGMEALEVLPCGLFVADSAVGFRFFRFQSSWCRLRLSNHRG